MTHLEMLQERLQIAEEIYGSSAPVTLTVRQQIEEMQQKLSSSARKPKSNESRGSRTSLRNENLLRYQAGLRKGEQA